MVAPRRYTSLPNCPVGLAAVDRQLHCNQHYRASLATTVIWIEFVVVDCGIDYPVQLYT